MKGIILAGGAGTRLFPASLPISKILLTIYNKPMIYYPLTTFLRAGIKDILIITNEADYENFRKLLGDGSQIGINIKYRIQYVQKGIADAFLIGEDFIDKDSVALILGDNIFYGNNFGQIMKNAISKNNGATIFGYEVSDPERFGVVEFDENKKVLSLEEKPLKPKSNYAVTGLYFYDNNVCKYAQKLKPSKRGELEITDLNKIYLEKGKLDVELLDKSFEWLDTGTHDSMLEASNYVKKQEKNGISIGCIEEAAYIEGFIPAKDLFKNLEKYGDKNEYYNNIRKMLISNDR